MKTACFPIWAGFELPPEHFLPCALFETPQHSKRALFLFSKIRSQIDLNVIRAVLANDQHLEHGVVVVPFPISKQ